MDWKQFKKYVVVPTLKEIGLYSESAANLIIGTAAVESNGEHVKQLGDGVALGFFQMEPATYEDIFENFLRYRSELEAKVIHLAAVSSLQDGEPPNKTQLITNMAFACAMCRVHYLRERSPLPPHDDVEAMARYWKENYNTNKGKGTIEKFIEKFPMEIL